MNSASAEEQNGKQNIVTVASLAHVFKQSIHIYFERLNFFYTANGKHSDIKMCLHSRKLIDFKN